MKIAGFLKSLEYWVNNTLNDLIDIDIDFDIVYKDNFIDVGTKTVCFNKDESKRNRNINQYTRRRGTIHDPREIWKRRVNKIY